MRRFIGTDHLLKNHHLRSLVEFSITSDNGGPLRVLLNFTRSMNSTISRWKRKVSANTAAPSNRISSTNIVAMHLEREPVAD